MFTYLNLKKYIMNFRDMYIYIDNFELGKNWLTRILKSVM